MATNGRRHATLRTVLGAAALSLLASFAPFSTAHAQGPCALTATASGPTVQQVVEQIAPGQTACVRGTVAGNVAIRRPDITLTSEPGQRGRIIGQVKVMPGGDRATVRDLDLDGSSEPEKPSQGIYANDVSFIGNDITNRDTEICFILGYGDIVVERTLIQGNRIHNCGERPESNMDHGIYVESSLDARIVGNEIFDNADRGIQLYPWSRGTLVAGNVIDGNGVGVIFGGLEGSSASNNTVRYNVITNSRVRNDVESWYPAGTPAGVGNVVERNCVDSAGIGTTFGGFTARDNVGTAPVFADRSAKDFRVTDGVCAELLAAGRAGLDYTPPAAAAPAPAPKPAAAPKPSKGDAPLDVAVKPSKGKDTVTVQVKLDDPALSSARMIVEVRYGAGRKWKTVAKARVSRKRSFRKKLRVPRRSKSVNVRATVLDAKRSGSAKVVRKAGTREFTSVTAERLF
jgi:parallel beta-helix repeat protein